MPTFQSHPTRFHSHRETESELAISLIHRYRKSWYPNSFSKRFAPKKILLSFGYIPITKVLRKLIGKK